MTAGRPRFSVVVPALDEAEHLPRTLASLAAQDYGGDVEVVVVDNRSRDATVQVARAAGAGSSSRAGEGYAPIARRGRTPAAARASSPPTPTPSTPPDWLTRIDRQLRRLSDAVAVARPCTYAEPPW